VNSGVLLFLGTLFALAVSFWGLIIAPHVQIGRAQQHLTAATGEQYPVVRVGGAQRGAAVYRAQGCVECHTQQVRPAVLAPDFERGWGQRRNVAQDYLHDHPVLIGDLRWGPDLSNVGARRPDGFWHLQHLYDPAAKSPGSKMPPYRYLFEERELAPGQKPSPTSIASRESADGGIEVVPKQEAYDLRDYLLSLRSEFALPEAPLPAPDTNQPPANVDTNAPASTGAIPTNAAATSPGVTGQ
jgi:cytochrome c oxidase cbb3-type subunit 2